jgi:hypothetical protein
LDRVTLNLNQLFQESKRIEVYKYLASKVEIDQDTLDQALNNLIRDGRGESRSGDYLLSLGANPTASEVLDSESYTTSLSSH